MDKERFYKATHIVLLIVVIVLTIINYVLDGCRDNIVSFVILIITIILEIVSMGYFIVQDIIDNERKLAKHGSLSLFDTIDRKKIVEEVASRITNGTKNGKHVIYINCKDLPDVEIENIKQRLYNDLTLGTDKIIKDLKIKNVFMPTSLDMETFYELIFFNRPANRFCKKINVYIYDKHTANYYFIRQINKKFKEYYKSDTTVLADNLDERKKRWAKNSFIVYLCDDDTANGINTSINEKDLGDLIESKTNSRCEGVKVSDIQNTKNINKVLVIDEILNDDFNKKIINNDLDMIYALYNLKTGKYSEALDILAKKNAYAGENIDLYKCYVIADTLHLLNCYVNASTFCEFILGRIGDSENGSGIEIQSHIQPYDMQILKEKTLKLNAHIMKHIGFFDCDDASGNDALQTSSNQFLEMLIEQDENEICNFVIEKKNINGYFKRLQRALNDQEKGISRDTEYLKTLINVFDSNKNPDSRMYYAAFSAYNNLIEANKCIDDIIEFYEKTDNRRRFNAYYVKAEILRNMQKHSEAYGFYMKSSGIEDGHIDVNLLDQNYFSLKAMEKLGLVRGTGSLCVKNYKARYFTREGFRLDESNVEHKFSQYPIVKKDEKSCAHAFNYSLLSYIDDETLSEEQLRRLLTENIFIIL